MSHCSLRVKEDVRIIVKLANKLAPCTDVICNFFTDILNIYFYILDITFSETFVIIILLNNFFLY